MKQILLDDMRDFVATELGDFCEARKLEEAKRALLVQLVSAALKSNPRRIREFGNNLELHLRVIEAREAPPRPQISPRISGDVLLIAKIRLLEEEWPRSYSALYGDPRLLAQWYEHMASGFYDRMLDGSDSRFIAFMNVARSIPDHNLRALLRLKQSRQEVRLPRSAEFHEALVEGQTELVQEIVGAEGVQPSSYADRLPPILREEIERFYLAGARNLVEVALTVETLRSQEEKIRDLMVIAADSRPLRLDLRNVSAIAPLFGAADLLDRTRLNQLMEPWVKLNEFFAESRERAAAVVEELLPKLPNLNEERRGELSKSLLDEQLRASIGTYLPLVEAEPELPPAELSEVALQGIGERLSSDSEAYRLFRVWLRRSEVPQGLTDTFATRLAAILQEAGAASDEPFPLTHEELEAHAETLASIKTLSDPDQLLVTCHAAFPAALKAGVAQGLLDLCNEVLMWESQSAASISNALVSLYYAHDADALLAYAASHAENLSHPLTNALLAKMSEMISDTGLDAERRLEAARAIVALDTDDGLQFLRTCPTKLVSAGDWPMALALWDDIAVEFDGVGATTSALERARAEAPTISPAAQTFLAKVLPAMDEEQLEELRNVLETTIASGSEGAVDAAAVAADEFARVRSEFADQRALLIRQQFDTIVQAPTPSVSIIRVVAERAEALDRDRRAALVPALRRWLHAPTADRLGVARAAQVLEKPSARERHEIVDALIVAETAAVGDSALRRELLLIASRLRGPKNSRADKRFMARIEQLRSERGEENDRLLQELGEAQT